MSRQFCGGAKDILLKLSQIRPKIVHVTNPYKLLQQLALRQLLQTKTRSCSTVFSLTCET